MALQLIRVRIVRRFLAAGYSTKRYSGRDSHSVRDEIRADFAAARTVRVEGWILSATEARLCGLAALSAA